MIQPRCALRDVLAAAEHTVAAPGHKASFASSMDGTAPTPALWFVGDDGLCLMSNGLPGQPHPDGGTRLPVGYDTAMSTHAIADQIGGDDVADGVDLLVIELDTTSMPLFVADTRQVTR